MIGALPLDRNTVAIVRKRYRDRGLNAPDPRTIRSVMHAMKLNGRAAT